MELEHEHEWLMTDDYNFLVDGGAVDVVCLHCDAGALLDEMCEVIPSTIAPARDTSPY